MSQVRTVTFVRFFYPGSLVSETSTHEVADRDTSKLDVPKGAFGWNFYDKLVVEAGGKKLWGPEENTSGTTYLGEVYDLARVKREMPNERILISNMEGNGFERVVVTGRGTFPLRDGDEVRQALCST